MSTVQDIFTKFYDRYLKQYKPSAEQAKVALAIQRCKTAALGGHVCGCEECGHLSVHYNSCRDRHCPMCQGVNKIIWVDQRRRDILNAPYFHLMFTLPQELHTLVYQNQKLLYALMYRVVAETLTELAADEKYLGAQVGFFSLLHTWAQDLHYHPHIHTVVLAGGLTKLNQWRNSSKDFFIPVKVLSKVFAGKFLYYLKAMYRRNELQFYGNARQYHQPKAFDELVEPCYNKNWYTFSRETFTGAEAVIQYLGRYTHRIAISNTRIVSVNENDVTFTVRDGKVVTLSGVEFIRRFLMNVLPRGFVKVRYYGILAHRNKKTKLRLCRKLIRSPVYIPKFEGLSTIEVLRVLFGRDVTLCPACRQGKLIGVSGASP